MNPIREVIRDQTRYIDKTLRILSEAYERLLQDPTWSTQTWDDKPSIIKQYISFAKYLEDSYKWRDDRGHDRTLACKTFRNKLSDKDVMPTEFLKDIYLQFHIKDNRDQHVYEFIEQNAAKLNECRDVYMKMYVMKKNIPNEAILETTTQLIDVIIASSQTLGFIEFKKEATKRRLERPIVVGKLILERFSDIPQIWTWEEMFNYYKNKKKDADRKKGVTSKAKYFTDYGEEPDKTAINDKYGYKLEDIKEELIGKSPWKSARKVSHYARRHELPKEFDNLRDISKDSFNWKQQRRVMKHYVAGRYTFQIDHMESGRFKYLLAINVNTRKAFFAIPDEIRRSGYTWEPPRADGEKWQVDRYSVVNELKHIMEQTPINAIMADEESAFTSHVVQKFLKNNNIEFKCVHHYSVEGIIDTNTTSRSTHNTTALVDRLIGTLRQMNYNLGLPSQIVPETLYYLINEYNNSIHTTLSQILKRKVTPNDVDGDVNLENELVKRIHVKNFFVEESAEYQLKDGAKVRVYNDCDFMDKVKPKLLPGTWEFVERDGGLYKVRQGKNIIKVPRWFIKDA